MIVEVTGAGFHNMGANLMLDAVVDQAQKWDFVEAVSINFRIGSRAQRTRAGVRSVLELDSTRRPWANSAVASVARALPRATLQRLGATHPSSVGAVLDASGFAFGDQWGPDAALDRERRFHRRRRSGARIVMLPQAFGPFTRKEAAGFAKVCLDQTDLVFARDPESMSHLEGLRLEGPQIALSPDFTNLIEPTVHRMPEGLVVLVPNQRMVEMVPEVNAEAYERFLVQCGMAAVELHHPVLIIAHESMDRSIARRVSHRLGSGARILEPLDPRSAKGAVSGAAIVVSSRYHGLVNALSQGVPAIGTSWSHKYDHLVSDYGCEDALWSVHAPDTSERFREWLDPTFLAERSRRLADRAKHLAERSRAMWGEVEALLQMPRT